MTFQKLGVELSFSSQATYWISFTVYVFWLACQRIRWATLQVDSIILHIVLIRNNFHINLIRQYFEITQYGDILDQLEEWLTISVQKQTKINSTRFQMGVLEQASVG